MIKFLFLFSICCGRFEYDPLRHQDSKLHFDEKLRHSKISNFLSFCRNPVVLMCFQSALWLELCRVLPDWRHDRRRLEVQKSCRWRMSRAWRNSCCLWKRKPLKLRCYIWKLKISQFFYLRHIQIAITRKPIRFFFRSQREIGRFLLER